MSHFDGQSAVTFRCGVCRIPGHDELRGNDKMCEPCQRFQIIQKIANAFSRYSLPALLLGISIWFFDIFAEFKFLLPFLAVIFLIPILVSTSIVQLQIYRGIDPIKSIVHKLKYYSLLKYNENIYYTSAADSIQEAGEINSQHRQILLYYLVEYLFLENKPKPDNYLEIWTEGLNLSEEKFIELSIEHTNLIQAFSYDKGVGILPDLWEFIKKDKEVRDLVLDKLTEASQNLENATSPERMYFLEDMYLIEEDLIEIIEAEQKWFAIDDVLVEFEPETPPSNLIESFKAQANENARAIEQRNLEKQQKQSQNQHNNQ